MTCCRDYCGTIRLITGNYFLVCRSCGAKVPVAQHIAPARLEKVRAAVSDLLARLSEKNLN